MQYDSIYIGKRPMEGLVNLGKNKSLRKKEGLISKCHCGALYKGRGTECKPCRGEKL